LSGCTAGRSTEIGLEASHLSHQLAALWRAHIVTTRREGSNVIYTVADRGDR
jgi:DNA-binding transcriptional ArsR family regulator